MPTAVVTGANRGIGLGFVHQLVARPDMRVVATLRDRSAAADLQAVADATGRVELADLDLNDETSIEAFAARVCASGAKIDLLIHNAGALEYQVLDELSFEVFRRAFGVMAFGPAVLTRRLRPALQPGGTIVLISSRLGSLAAANGRNGSPYRMAKAALNMFARQLAHELRPDGIRVVPISPGLVRTRMTGTRGLIDVDTSVQGMLAVIDGVSLERSGEFLSYDGTTAPW